MAVENGFMEKKLETLSPKSDSRLEIISKERQIVIIEKALKKMSGAADDTDSIRQLLTSEGKDVLGVIDVIRKTRGKIWFKRASLYSVINTFSLRICIRGYLNELKKDINVSTTAESSLSKTLPEYVLHNPAKNYS